MKKKKRKIILLGKLYPWSSLSPVIYLHVGNDRVWQADSKMVPGISAIWCSCPLSASLSECGLDLVTPNRNSGIPLLILGRGRLWLPSWVLSLRWPILGKPAAPWGEPCGEPQEGDWDLLTATWMDLEAEPLPGTLLSQLGFRRRPQPGQKLGKLCGLPMRDLKPEGFS